MYKLNLNGLKTPVFRAFIAIVLALTVTSYAATTQAKDLTIGLSAAITSMDPHYHNLTPNNGLLRHVFDSLIRQDFAQNLVPGLAKS